MNSRPIDDDSLNYKRRLVRIGATVDRSMRRPRNAEDGRVRGDTNPKIRLQLSGGFEGASTATGVRGEDWNNVESRASRLR